MDVLFWVFAASLIWFLGAVVIMYVGGRVGARANDAAVLAMWWPIWSPILPIPAIIWLMLQAHASGERDRGD